MEEIKKNKAILEKKIKDALIEFTSKNTDLCIYQIELKNTLCMIEEQELSFVSKIDVNCRIKIL